MSLPANQDTIAARRPFQRLPARALCLTALVAASLVGCRSPSLDGTTALRVAAAWAGMELDQLEYTIMTRDGALHAPERRPEVAQGPLVSGVDVVIYLPDELAGQEVRCLVRGYLRALPQGQGESRVNITAGTVVDVQVAVAALSGNDAGGSGSDAGTGPDGVGRRKDNGLPCSNADDCASGHCRDGVCCDTACLGPCVACNPPGKLGTCSALPGGVRDSMCAQESVQSCGLDGTCNGSGACRRYPAGTSCLPGTCSGSTVVGSGACDGAGKCVVGTTGSCGEYLCDSAAQACRTSCSSSAECSSPNVCSAAGRCGPFKPPGGTCSVGTECVSGNCVDGVCCRSPSCDPCSACNLAASAGTCRPVANGTPEPHRLCPVQPVSTCGLDGTCDGQGACRSYPDGTVCRMARICFGGVCR